MTPARVTLGRDLLQHFKPFSAHAVFACREASGIASRCRQAFDIAAADRIGDLDEHDRYGARACSSGPNVEVPLARMTSGVSATSSAAWRRMSSDLIPSPAGLDTDIVADGPS